MTVGETVVGLPQDTGPLVYYYNEAEFERLGLTVPTDVASLTVTAEAAAAQGHYAAAFTPDEAWNWLAAQSAAAGDTWFSAVDGEWKVETDGPGSQVVATLWQGLIDSGSVPVEERWADAFTQMLTDGRLIGHVGAAWEAGFLLDPLDGTPAEGQWRVAQLPDLGAGPVTGPDGGSGVAVMEGCERPAEAVEFAAWFNTQIDDLASQGLVVAATGTPATPEKMTRQFGGQDVLGELATANANLAPDFPYAPGFGSLIAMNEQAAKVTSGATVASVFDVAQTTAVTSLTNLGLPVSE
ncbi:extracellular solute-binding protein [Litorihabitans aurantiacus]|uniref:Extracellular solute-binding protein n=1 Tax=Litorihabitans aurantiacus TaxID=1930061 RepID=A0AA37XDI7_9MICO|nr:extracellular solute-binding protein [Litorihabitans aurantiacus]GMA31260.1 hypothetical protein GCM10025875_12520 [Litorihabitans aurantiacus]